MTLLHVQDAAKISPHLDERVEEFNRIDKARLEGMKKLLQDRGEIEVDVVVKYGSPAVEIIKTVEENGIPAHPYKTVRCCIEHSDQRIRTPQMAASL